MKTSVLTLANLTIAAMLLLAPFLVGLTASAPYDPWADLDANGDIDIFDVVKIAGSYAIAGDPSKNVNVTNWPTDRANTVWYWQNMNPSQALISDHYNAYGFGQLHVLAMGGGLTGTEQIDVQVTGIIQHPAIPSGTTNARSTGLH